MFDSHEIKNIEDIIGCKIPENVIAESRNGESPLWDDPDAFRFTFITVEGHLQLKPFVSDKTRSPLPQIPELKIFWSDSESNFLGMFVSGPLLGRLAVVGHDTNIDCAPLYRNLQSFIEAERAGATTSDAEWPYRVDYPNTGDETVWVSSKGDLQEDLASLEQIEKLAASAYDSFRKRFLGSCIVSLTPKERATQLLPLLKSSDYHVCGRACSMLGYYQFDPAAEQLREIASDSNNPARFRAVDGLGLMRTKAAQSVLTELVRSGKPLPGNITTALKRNAFELLNKRHSENGRNVIEWHTRFLKNGEYERVNIGPGPRPVYWWNFGL